MAEKNLNEKEKKELTTASGGFVLVGLFFVCVGIGIMLGAGWGFLAMGIVLLAFSYHFYALTKAAGSKPESEKSEEVARDKPITTDPRLN